MRKIEIILESVHKTVHKNETGSPAMRISIGVEKKPYSAVRLYVTRTGGKPAIIKGRYWYVYYYFADPVTGKKKKFTEKCDLNRHRTVEERMRWGRAWVETFTLLLSQGYNPFDPHGIAPKDFQPEVRPLRQALQYAHDNLRGQLKQATAEDYKVRMNVFLQWAAEKGIDGMPVTGLGEAHVIAYLNWLTMPKPDGRGVGLTSQDNYKRGLSALLGKLKRDKVIADNPLEAIETRKGKPVKNTPFTGHQVREISQYLKANDPKLYRFIQFVIYGFLRPREIVRLRVSDFNLSERFLTIETKTEGRAMVRLIGPLVEYLEQIGIARLPGKAHIFTDSGEIGVWTKGEKAKTDHFGIRFRKVKEHFGLGEQYGIYSFRHTAALDLYHAFVRDGAGHVEAVRKLMPILRHTSEKTTEKYLREIGAQLPKDYGALYTLEF